MKDVISTLILLILVIIFTLKLHMKQYLSNFILTLAIATNDWAIRISQKRVHKMFRLISHDGII